MKALAMLAIGLAPVAQAQTTCPANATIGTIDAPGFTCTVADKTFSAFSITGAPTSALVSFGQLGPLFAVTLTRDGAFFAPGVVNFDYTITPTVPDVIRIGTLGVDVSFPSVITVTTMNGAALTPASITNGGSSIIFFTPGVASVVVDNTAHIIGATAELNSISNDFSQVPIGIPEPGTLALAVSGFAGLAFIWRRRR